VTPYQALVAAFGRDENPETPEEMARLLLKLLHQQGFAVVPLEATKGIKNALRQAMYQGAGGPAKAWSAAVSAAEEA